MITLGLILICVLCLFGTIIGFVKLGGDIDDEVTGIVLVMCCPMVIITCLMLLGKL